MSKKTLNETNLAALGAEKLAALLMEVSTGSADIKRRLRLELSHNLGAAELAHDVRKRLASIRKSKSYVGWRKRKALIKDLSTQVTMIKDKIAPEDPTIAFDLLWSFVELAPSVYARTDDSRGEVQAVFHSAMQAFPDLGPRAGLDPIGLADRVWAALRDNDYGEWDDVIPVMASSLGTAGLEALQKHVEAYAEAPMTPTEDHDAIAFLRTLRDGSDYATSQRSRFVKLCLQEIASCLGDTDAYIAQYSTADLRHPRVAAEVANLQLTDGAAQAALDTLLNADEDAPQSDQAVWDATYIAALTALGQHDTAQDHRWQCFEDRLDPHVLRDYLRQLPDFEDVEAQDRAMAYAARFPDMTVALSFFMTWPDHLGAAQLISNRHHDIDGRRYDILSPAAEALRERHPLAAVLLWRAIIESILWQGETKRYARAVEHLHDCATVDVTLEDYMSFPTHEAYLEDLRKRYAKKSVFWAKVVA